MAQEREVKSSKYFDGRLIKLPYYCPDHFKQGRYYCRRDNDNSLVGLKKPKVLKFNMPLCNNIDCNRLLAPFDIRLENPDIKQGYKRPRFYEGEIPN